MGHLLQRGGLARGVSLFIAATTASLCLSAGLRCRSSNHGAQAAFDAATPAPSFPLGRSRPILSPFSVDSHTLPPAEDLPSGTLRVLTLGDSVAVHLGVTLRYRQDEANAFVAERGVGHCSIFAPEDPDGGNLGNCTASWKDDVVALRPDVTFIVLGGGYFGSRAKGSRIEASCDPGYRDAYRDRLHALLDEMGSAAGRVVLAIVPYPGERWRSDGLLRRVDCYNGILREVASRRQLGLVDLMSRICPTPDCAPPDGGRPVRPDGLHPDGEGAEDMARWTLRELQRLAPRAGDPSSSP